MFRKTETHGYPRTHSDTRGHSRIHADTHGYRQTHTDTRTRTRTCSRATYVSSIRAERDMCDVHTTHGSDARTTILYW